MGSKYEEYFQRNANPDSRKIEYMLQHRRFRCIVADNENLPMHLEAVILRRTKKTNTYVCLLCGSCISQLMVFVA